MNFNSFFFFFFYFTFLNAQNPSSNEIIIKSISQANPARSLVPLRECPICNNSELCDTCNIPINNFINIRNTIYESRLLLNFKLPTSITINTCKFQMGNLINNIELAPSSSEIIISESNTNFNPSMVNWNTMPSITSELSRLNISFGNIIDITNACINSINNNNSTLILIVSPTQNGPQQLYFEDINSLNGPKLVIN